MIIAPPVAAPSAPTNLLDDDDDGADPFSSAPITVQLFLENCSIAGIAKPNEALLRYLVNNPMSASLDLSRIGGAYIGPRGVLALALTLPSLRLTRLVIGENNASAEAFSEPDGQNSISSSFRTDKGPLEDPICALARAAAAHPTLTALDVSGNILRSQAADALRDAVIRNERLIDVNVSQCGLLDASARRIAALCEARAVR